MNLHNTVSDSCDKCPFYCTCCLYDATESRQITKKWAHKYKKYNKALHTSTTAPHTYTCRKKNSWSIWLLYTRALKEMERAAPRGERSHHYLCVRRNGLLQSAATVSLVRLQHQQRPICPLFPHCFKRHINNAPLWKSHCRCYAHQAKINCCNARPKITHLLKGSDIEEIESWTHAHVQFITET